MTPLTFTSYNIHKGIGLDRRRDPARVLAVLNEIAPDVVALQEADRRFGRRSAVLPHWLVQVHSDLKPVPLDVAAQSMGWHGNVLLVRRDITILAHDVLHLPCIEPRGAVFARLARADGKQFGVIGAHLDLSGLWRVRQVQAILKAIGERAAGLPIVVMGDFNAWRPAAASLRLIGQRLVDVPCGPSFHARRPVVQLDRILHSRDWQAADCGVHESALARRASDHLPIWARLGL